jgi:ATP-binding cassette subfamily B protein RaxB
VLATPYYMQLAIDDALPALDIEFLALLALGFGLFALLNAAATLLRAFVLLSAGNSLGYGIAVNVSRRLFRLSIEWFEKRHIGDVISRFQSVAPVRQFLTEGATASLVDGSLALATLAVMFVYSPRLAIIAIAAFGLYGLVRMLSFGPQRQAQEEAIVASGREQSTIIETVRGIATFRLFNREAIRHALWQSRLTDSMNAAMSVIRISAWQNAANGLIFSVEMILSIWVGVGMAMAGSLSLGMLFAFISYKAQFLQRGASLIDQIFAFRMMGLHLERLGDIVHAEQDRSFAATQPPRLLRGQVELRQVSFRYSPSDPMVLENVNLVVEPGDHIAITGPSGGGKSTLVKILLGLVEPTEGEVLIDGAPLASFGHRNFRDQTGAVLQDDHLFAGSLFENITLFEDVPDQSAVTRAVEAAALHDDISAMPMGYDTLVGDMGSALSGGQKQRLLLARALYREPRLLVMDEGTSHLDVEREQRVNHFISALGVTRVIIAHRRETILAAERVYSLSAGRLTDVTTVYGVKAV